jgi:hypothetical protein
MAEAVADEELAARTERFLNGEYVERDTLEPLKYLRWYYADKMRNLSVHDQFCDNPEWHKEFFIKHNLWRKETPRWLAASGRAIQQHLVPLLGANLENYLQRGYDALWAYDLLRVNSASEYPVCVIDDADTAANRQYRAAEAFAKIWDTPELFVPYAGDLVLFEGQADGITVTKDMLEASLGDVVVRQAPSLTTWNLNAATWDLSIDKPQASVLVVHHVRDPQVKAFVAQEVRRRGFGSAWLKCDIMLQLNIEITVESQSFDKLDSYDRNRSEDRQGVMTVRVLHTNVKKLVST